MKIDLRGSIVLLESPSDLRVSWFVLLHASFAELAAEVGILAEYLLNLLAISL